MPTSSTANSSRWAESASTPPPGQIYGLLGPERRRQDHRAANSQHGAAAHQRPGHGATASTCVTQSSQVRHQIGFMSANTGVYDRMTAWEMVEYFGRLYGIAKEPLRAADGSALRRGWR